MSYGINRMEREDIDNKTDKTVIEKWFRQKYRMCVEDLKKKIAGMIIDFTGLLDNDGYLLIRVMRPDKIYFTYFYNKYLKFHEGDAFHFILPIHCYRDLPSGHRIGSITSEGYELLNTDGHLVEYLSEDVLKKQLVNDLVEHNSCNFNNLFDKFLTGLYNWEHEKVE